LRAFFGAFFLACRQHSPAQKNEIEDSDGQQYKSHRRHSEEPKGILSPLAQDVVENNQGPRGHHGQGTTDDGGKPDRHKQARLRYSCTFRDAKQSREEKCRCANVLHEGRDEPNRP
jgi:hypothetical protein